MYIACPSKFRLSILRPFSEAALRGCYCYHILKMLQFMLHPKNVCNNIVGEVTEYIVSNIVAWLSCAVNTYYLFFLQKCFNILQ